MEENADDVLIQAGEAYRSFESYSDVGHVETLWNAGTHKERLSELTFNTYFKRPNLVRFEWCDPNINALSSDRVNVIWSDGKQFYRKNCFDTKPKQMRSANVASSGTGSAILALLTDQICGIKLTDLKAPCYVGSEIVEGEECHHLSHPSRSTHIWVAKPRSIVLRIREEYIIEAGSAAKIMKDARFLSFSLFILWLKHNRRERSRQDRGEDLHVSRKITYNDVITNADIPDMIFSLNGPNLC